MSVQRPTQAMSGILRTLRVAEAATWLPPPDAVASEPAAPEPTSEQVAQQVAHEVSRIRAELEVEKELEVAQAKRVAEQEARAKIGGELEATKARYAEAVRTLTEAAEEIRATYSTRTVELALMIAREVLGRELSFDRASLVARVEEALMVVGHEPSIRVRLGTADAAFLLGRRPDLVSAGVELVEEPSLAPGACFVESSRRMIDASIEVRLSVVREILADASSLADQGAEEVQRVD